MPSELPSKLPPASLPAVTLRSILIGLAGVCFICGLSPYNDFAMENTFLIGNFLPIGLLLIVLTLVIGVNAPLLRFAPTQALRQSELAVIVLMVLVGCSVPSSGLMRYLPSSLTGIYSLSADRPSDWGAAIDAANIPNWLLPTVDGNTAAEKGYQDVFTQFRGRAPGGVVPWAAWVRPFFVWGALVAMLWGLLISLSLIVRKQWTDNERLSFPLATIYQSLIDPPAPGRSLNTLFRSPGFWIAAGVVFAIHSINALSAYDPSWPKIPLGFNAYDMLVDPPWSFVQYGMKETWISFSMIGIAFFIQTKTAFSLWFFYIIWQVAEMMLGTAQIPLTESMRHDQTFGGMIVFCGVILYIGRRHWWMVLRHMVGKRRDDEHPGLYLPYIISGWVAVICFVGIIVWFCLAGVSLWAAVVITLVMVMLFMVVARVLADTGLIFVQVNFQLIRAFYYPVLIPPTPQYTTQTNFVFAGWMTELFHDLRESLAGFFQMGIRVTDEAIAPQRRSRGVGLAIVAAVVLSLGVAYFVSWASTLSMEYRYAQTTSSSARIPNIYGVEDAVRVNVMERAAAYRAQSLGAESKTPFSNPLLQIGIGGGIVGACSAFRVLFSWWPLHPVAFIVLYSFAVQKIWSSILIGWVAKVLVIRFGGASLLKSCRSFFIGLIIGEAFTAAVWLIINIIRNANNLEYKSLLFLPG